MSDADYWRTRCEAAEDALRRARSRVWISPSRQAVLSLLADLKHNEAKATSDVAKELGMSHEAALMLLNKLHEAGMVDRNRRRGCKHAPIRWKLAHMVTVEA